MKTAKSGDEGSAQPTEKSGDEVSTQPTEQSGDEVSAQPNKAPSNTTNQHASEKTPTTNTGEESAQKKQEHSKTGSKTGTQLGSSDAKEFLLRVRGRQASTGKGSHVCADIVSGGGDEDVVKTTGSHKRKATKNGVSPGNKAESSPAQLSTEPVKQSQSVKKSSSPAPPPPP